MIFFHFAFFLYVAMETYSLLYDERVCCDHNHPFLIEGMYLLMKKIACALLSPVGVQPPENPICRSTISNLFLFNVLCYDLCV